MKPKGDQMKPKRDQKGTKSIKTNKKRHLAAGFQYVNILREPYQYE